MEDHPKLSIEEGARVVQKLVEVVGQAVKRLSPARIVTHVAGLLHAALDDSKRDREKILRHYPPHLLAHLLEIHAYAARNPSQYEKFGKRFDEAMKALHDFKDPFQWFALEAEDKIFYFFQAMSHIQFALQNELSRPELSRCWIIFNHPGVVSASRVFGRPADWFLFSFWLFGASHRNPGRVLNRHPNVPDAWVWYSRELEEAVFQQLAWTRQSLQAAFADRLKKAPHLTFVGRPLLTLRPLYDLAEDRFVVVHSGLLFEACSRRILELSYEKMKMRSAKRSALRLRSTLVA